MMVTDPCDNDQTDLEAGDFGSWLAQMRGALRGEQGSDVPCDGCTACCTSSQFIHIGPNETDTLAHIPPELLFPAPRLPRGHVLLGYDERGHCPMLVDSHCTIYEHRPVTCRTYDCRVFPACELTVDDGEKAAIDRQARRWRFSFPAQADRDQHNAVRAAATYLRDHPDAVGGGAAGSATQLAVLAVEVHEAFLGRDEHVDEAAIRVEVQRRARS